MNKISSVFNNGKALICYLTAGDPSPEKSVEFIKTLSEAGADLIEIGLPFSDPVAEGEIIERSSNRALAVNTNTDTVFDIIKNARDCSVNTPLVMLTYINPVFVYGYERFFSKCAQYAIDGLIIPDIPFEERGELELFAEKHGVHIITLISPTSKPRISRIAKNAKGFVYLVSSMGVTGIRAEIETDLREITDEIRAATDTKIAVGFGISEPKQARKILTYADGVIIGSALVKIIEEHGDAASDKLFDYVCNMKSGML